MAEAIPPPKGPATGESPVVKIVTELSENRGQTIDRLKRISGVVSEANQEMGKGSENKPFNQKARRLIELGNGYTSYLESHGDEITDPNIFQHIVTLAKTSYFMNIEHYGRTIQEIGGYVAAHPDLNALNPPGVTDGPWSNIKEYLYRSTNNDIREQYRERIFSKSQLLLTSRDMSVRDLDHLERFLVDPQGRAPKQFIPEYVNQHASDLKQWMPLSLSDFQGFVVDRLKDFHGDLPSNTFLQQVDEELASIKPEQTKGRIQYPDREKKLAFIRDLRFGRADFQKVQGEVQAMASDISRRDDLRSLGPLLQDKFPALKDALKESVGQDPKTRKETMFRLIDSLGLPSTSAESVKNYLELHLKTE